MPDKLHRFLLENLHVRGEWVKLDTAWQEILKTSSYPKPIQTLLGEATAAIALLAASLKFKGSLVLQMNDTYPVNMFVVQAKSDGSVRAIARWEGGIGDQATFGDLFRDENKQSHMASMVISVEQEDSTERYQSIIALQGNSIAETLSAYFEQSEQLPTHFFLSANEESAAGFMLQSLPSEFESEGWNHALTLAKTITNDELLDLTVEELLHRLYHEEDLRLYDPEEIHFKCTCSQQKIDNMIRSLGEKEADSVIQEKGNISIDCQFCNQRYELDAIDVRRIFTEIGNPGTGNLH
ncbi:MAG: Hsp33 family molecular chaperone HslO [Thiotrichaceae bacterium]